MELEQYNERQYVELANKAGERKYGILIGNTLTDYKISFKGEITDYPKKDWFIVQPNQNSARFKAYRLLPLGEQ